MNAQERRGALLLRLNSGGAPVSASALAREFGVSRQIIVGDVALLRAGGAEILSTPRGYALSQIGEGLRRSVACVHDEAGTERELLIMVENGCVVRDVIVEHPVYGLLTGALALSSRADVAHFLEKSAGVAPLSSLTGGIHLHTLLCPDEEAFQRVRKDLEEAGFLLNEE